MQVQLFVQYFVIILLIVLVLIPFVGCPFLMQKFSMINFPDVIHHPNFLTYTTFGKLDSTSVLRQNAQSVGSHPQNQSAPWRQRLDPSIKPNRCGFYLRMETEFSRRNFISYKRTVDNFQIIVANLQFLQTFSSDVVLLFS